MYAHYEQLVEDFRPVKGRPKRFQQHNIWVPKFYEALAEEGLKPREARNVIQHDPRIGISRRSLLMYSPKEAKNPQPNFKKREMEFPFTLKREENLDEEEQVMAGGIPVITGELIGDTTKIYRPQAELALEKERDELKTQLEKERDELKAIIRQYEELQQHVTVDAQKTYQRYEEQIKQLNDKIDNMRDTENIAQLKIDQLTADTNIIKEKFVEAESKLVTKDRELDQVAHQLQEQQAKISELVDENHKLKTGQSESTTLKMLDAEIEELKQPHEAITNITIEFKCPNCGEVRSISWATTVKCTPEYKTVEVKKMETTEHHIVKKGFMVQRT